MFEGLEVDQGITGIWVYQKNGVCGYNWVYFPDALCIELIGGTVEQGFQHVDLNENLRTFMQDAGLSTVNLPY